MAWAVSSACFARTNFGTLSTLQPRTFHRRCLTLISPMGSQGLLPIGCEVVRSITSAADAARFGIQQSKVEVQKVRIPCLCA